LTSSSLQSLGHHGASVLRHPVGARWPLSLPGSSCLVEAAAAVDRAVIPRNERHHRVGSALRADNSVHLAGVASRSLPSACSAASGATLRLVHQTLLCKELLLAHREHELLCAVATLQGLVRKAHVFLSPFSSGGIWSQFGRCSIRCGGLAEEPGSRIRRVAIAESCAGRTISNALQSCNPINHDSTIFLSDTPPPGTASCSPRRARLDVPTGGRIGLIKRKPSAGT
jgi:hypothetical protein